MKSTFRTALAIAALAVAAQAHAQITLFEHDGFAGRSITLEDPTANLERFGFSDRASSVVVRGGRWEVCENIRFGGQCVVLREGRYPSLSVVGLNDRISSVRSASGRADYGDDRRAPDPYAGDDYRRRGNERLYEATVTSVRAVLGTPEQRCWVEREAIPQAQGGPNIPGAIAGALIGGILGHQVGGGTGKDVATVGGVVAGAAVGSSVGRDRGAQQTRDVQRCESVPSQARPDYWDVVYVFRGQEHRVQMTAPPGETITVNEQGEPRQ